jgi:hypothetical protein
LQTIGSFEFHHNAPAHKTLSLCEFLAKKCISVLPQAPFSPDLSPYDKGYRFQTLDSVQKGVTDAIETVSEAGFQSCHWAWRIRWANCVAAE